jgi:DNA-binding transcriptional ArsR family regulator
LKYDQTTISHNLKHLNEYGFVFVHRNGKQRIYKLNEKTVLPLMKLIDKHLHEMEEDIEKSFNVD